MADLGWDVAVNAAATVASAFGGAWAAFRYNAQQERGRVVGAQVEECNRTMLVLVHQFNYLRNYQRQVIEPWRGHEARHLFLPRSDFQDFSHLRVNVAALAFLVETQATEMPFMLGLADDAFHGAIEAINGRSVLHDEFQRVLGDSTINSSVPAPLSEFHKAIGPRLTVSLQKSTDQVIDLVDSAVASLTATGRMRA